MSVGVASTPAGAVLRDAAGAPRLHPHFGRGPIRAEIIERPADDDAATEQTLAYMRMLATEDAGADLVKMAAAAATRGAASISDKLAGIHSWVRRHVRYVDDGITAGLAGLTNPDDTEVLIRPRDLLAMPAPAGDCDDFAMLTAAMLLAAGIPAQFRAVAANPAEPDAYSHVYAEARTAGGAVPLDTSHGPRPGWAAPNSGKETMKTLGNVAPWVQDLIKIGVETGSTIARNRYAAPPPGLYQTGPAGTVYRQQPGAGPLAFPGGGLELGGLTPLLMIGGLAVVLIVATRRK